MMEKELINISLRVKPGIVEKIDHLREKVMMPRTSWVYQAILDKIKKEEKEENDLD